MSTIFAGILLGLGGCVAMNAWAILISKLGLVPYPNWAIPGRWFGYLLVGKISHENIVTSDPISGEYVLGWFLHLSVGSIFGMIFLQIVGHQWLVNATALPALIFGTLTAGFGWFLVQPSMGMGIMASKTPNPSFIRFTGLLSNTVFGLGLWITAETIY